jgi:hypothetical protein
VSIPVHGINGGALRSSAAGRIFRLGGVDTGLNSRPDRRMRDRDLTTIRQPSDNNLTSREIEVTGVLNRGARDVGSSADIFIRSDT